MDETLDHEERFWIVQVHPSLVVDTDQQLFRISARRAVAAFTLIGGEPAKVKAESLINRIEGQVDKRMLTVLHNLYVGAAQSTGRPGYIGALEPDLLGEAMVFRTLCREDDGAEALLTHVFEGCHEDAIENGFVVLARLSIKHEAEASAWIDRVVRQDLAGRALAALKAAKAASKDSAHALLGMVLAKALTREGTKEIAERLEEAGIPDGTVSLREVIVWVTLMRLRDLPRSDDVTELGNRSARWNNLGVRQSELGQREAALASIQEAVALCRPLAAASPDAFLADLAKSLNNLGNRQIELAQHGPALASVQEAVDIYNNLTAKHPNSCLPDLAMSLTKLGSARSHLGQHEDARICTQQAVTIYRALAFAEPDAFLPYLAVSLRNLGVKQKALDDREHALTATREALDIHRKLAATRPDAFLFDLAKSLHNMGIAQGDLGQHESALASTQEAVNILRTLAAARPEVFLSWLAVGLTNLGILQSNVDNHEAALASDQEALEAIWPMFLALPNAFRDDTGMILRNLRASLRNLGKEPTPELLARRETFNALAPK
jgi:tetratricopeptide (TPR) repeat protein